MPENDVVVAAVNMRCVVGDKPGNLSRIEHFAERASREGADLICFPEMSICGYVWDQRAAEYAEPIPGPSTEAVVRMARRHGVAIIAGLVERDARNRLFISQFVVTPEGVAGVYRKVHLGPSEVPLFQPGDQINVHRYQSWTFGLQLCFDAHFPELSATQALQGAGILFVPHASPREMPAEKRERFLRYLPARAYDNSCYVVVCNQAGRRENDESFAGVALILDPKGRVVAESAGWEDQMISTRLRVEEVERVRQSRMGYFLPHRRPDLYSGVVNESRDER